MISSQVVVSPTFDRNNIEGGLLGKYVGDMPLDQKFDITFDDGYIRGRWVTIVDDQAPSSLILAEVRVYGSKGRHSQKKTLYFRALPKSPNPPPPSP